MSEHQEQVKFFNWVRRNRSRSPNPQIQKAMKLCHAIPNGISTKQSQQAKMEGLTKGIPDVHLPWPVSTEYECHGEPHFYTTPGLYIEMKFGRNILSEDQEMIRDLLKEAGFKWERV